jgi:hypothetical protein
VRLRFVTKIVFKILNDKNTNEQLKLIVVKWLPYGHFFGVSVTWQPFGNHELLYHSGISLKSTNYKFYFFEI